jgi:hypothetical protein
MDTPTTEFSLNFLAVSVNLSLAFLSLSISVYAFKKLFLGK